MDSSRKRITSHNELDVYKRAFDAAMSIFGQSQRFPKEERYSLTDQIRLRRLAFDIG
jgi:hypothetical protein